MFVFFALGFCSFPFVSVFVCAFFSPAGPCLLVGFREEKKNRPCLSSDMFLGGVASEHVLMLSVWIRVTSDHVSVLPVWIVFFVSCIFYCLRGLYRMIILWLGLFICFIHFQCTQSFGTSWRQLKHPHFKIPPPPTFTFSTTHDNIHFFNNPRQQVKHPLWSFDPHLQHSHFQQPTTTSIFPTTHDNKSNTHFGLLTPTITSTFSTTHDNIHIFNNTLDHHAHFQKHLRPTFTFFYKNPDIFYRA